MKMKLKIKDKEYEVEISDAVDSGLVKITVNGNTFEFVPDTEANEPSVPQTVLPRRDFSAKEIKTAIAGIISEVFVKEGDTVKAGQKLLILSAMKMENEIVSEFDGKIKQVAVKQNDKVKEGDVLIRLV